MIKINKEDNHLFEQSVIECLFSQEKSKDGYFIIEIYSSSEECSSSEIQLIDQEKLNYFLSSESEYALTGFRLDRMNPRPIFIKKD